MRETIKDKTRQRLDKMIDGYQSGDVGNRAWEQFHLNLSPLENQYVRAIIVNEGIGKGGMLKPTVLKEGGE